MAHYVYQFNTPRTDGQANQKALLGGKGANLCEMARLGLPVPPGFVLTTEMGRYYLDHQSSYPTELRAQVDEAIGALEKRAERGFGDPANPLLLSVRSGAAISMPGMMETILNLGLNDRTVEGLIRCTDNARFGWDSYRRFIQMYGEVVRDIPPQAFAELLAKKKAVRRVSLDMELTAEELRDLVQEYLALYQAKTGDLFPQEPRDQLWGSIGAVFGSWMTARAKEYRRIHGIDERLSTACVVQTMVFGNLGATSGTGVLFTRNPTTGERALYGEYLANAQGEDIVAGIRTPLPINTVSGGTGKRDGTGTTLEQDQPRIYQEILKVSSQLEQHFREMQDMEFTVEQERLWLLQTRTGKRAAAAAVRIATDMVDEGLLSVPEALLRVEPAQLERLLHPRLDDAAKARAHQVARGLAAAPGGAVGRLVLTADDAVAWKERGEAVILVREETVADDIHGMFAAQGFLTAHGGLTSHAAVVARGMGKPCVASCEGLTIDESAKTITFAGGTTVHEGEWLSLDGSTGEVFLGQLSLTAPTISGEFDRLLHWADEHRRVQVRANAETKVDAEAALRFGAEGIGLARTEHMFFAPERIPIVRAMIMASDTKAREEALARLLPLQRQDFCDLLRVMAGRPITIRLLDPPLHEFLPTAADEVAELARHLGTTPADIQTRVSQLSESNPMLGHRGCRLGVTFPEIYAMQARAILEAAVAVRREIGKENHLEIEIPLVASGEEMQSLRALVDGVAARVAAETSVAVPYQVGAMLELPRACLCADQIAAHADFFSFGTNDLTQTTYGLSRDDAGHFMAQYVTKGLFAADPFSTLDTAGVGSLMRVAVELARRTKPQISIGICGEHGGDPASIAFCLQLGLDSVSCSPYRVPVARLAAAQTGIRQGGVS